MVQSVGAMLFSVVKTVLCHVENAALFFVCLFFARYVFCWLPVVLVKHT